MNAALSGPGVTASLRYCLLRYRRTWRGTIVISVANPALFLTGLGYGLGKLVDDRHSHYLHGATYLAFLAPGLLAAAMMQTAYLESAGPVHMAARQAGAYRVAVATPLAPTDVMVGHLLFVMFRVATSAAAFALVAFAFSAIPARGIVPVALAAVLTGAAFSAPVAAWAISVDRQALLNAGFRFVIMPMYMFCGTFFAVDQLPSWLQTVVRCTPLYQGVALSRAAAAGSIDTVAAAGHAAYLVVLVVAGMLAGVRTYRRVLTA
jgi:lipooligosaccharide transport system permease protein